jgi:hypothetical protein
MIESNPNLIQVYSVSPLPPMDGTLYSDGAPWRHNWIGGGASLAVWHAPFHDGGVSSSFMTIPVPCFWTKFPEQRNTAMFLVSGFSKYGTTNQ